MKYFAFFFSLNLRNLVYILYLKHIYLDAKFSLEILDWYLDFIKKSRFLKIYSLEK